MHGKTMFFHSPGQLAMIVLVTLGSWCAVATEAFAQRDAVQIEAVQDEEPPSENMLGGEDRYAGGAPLKTDPDLLDRLKKANEFRDDGNFRVASKLWQSVLGESGDILFTDNKETYYSLTEKVESILAELPASGLSSYRIAADAAAREILAQRKGQGDLDKLNQVVKSYFMSSFGDDAAYELGCIYLDRFDFVGAARLLRKIADQYPDPSVPMDQVWLRIAIAYVYVGDRESANQAIENAKQVGADPESRLFESITELMTDAPQLARGSKSGSGWQARFGNSRRVAQMPAVPEQLDGKNLMAEWQFFYEPLDKYLEDAYLGNTITSFAPEEIHNSVTSRETAMIKGWRQGRWRPAGTLLFDDKNVVFKTGSDLTVWNRELEEQPVWRPLWLNQFSVDSSSTYMKQILGQSGQSGSQPSVASHIQMFGDQIAQSMSTHRGVLYSLEGQEYSWKEESTSIKVQPNPGIHRQSSPRRTRTNRLAAYDLESGKIKWRMPTANLLKVAESDHNAKVEASKSNEGDPDKNAFVDIGFMAAPVGFGELLLAPVNVSGAIWLYAMDSKSQGELVWRSYLCDEPGGGSSPWSPIHIAIDGSSAYVNCGTGVVYALDPMTGGIRFARRYARTGKQMGGNRNVYNNRSELLRLDGWKEDVVIPMGRELIMLASDFSAVWAIDRESAKFRWKTDNRPFDNKFDYLIGINDEYVFLGGTHSVAAVSIKAQGRWAWVHSFKGEKSYGRAMMTRDAIYVPLENKIQKLALSGSNGSGQVLTEMNVRLGTGAPLGNLYCDGQRIWVVGGNRLYALGADDGSIPDFEGDEPFGNGDEKADKSSPDGTAVVD